MLIVDYSHLQARNLYIAISQAKPRKENGKFITNEFMPFFMHLMLNSLRLLGHKFENVGEVILAIDDRNYWRKEIYPDYKGHRKKAREESDINFEEFYAKAEELLNEIDEYFPYSVLRVPRCEADDIIGILCKHKALGERVVVVTSDKDMRQVISYGAEVYDPIKMEFVKMTKDQVRDYKIMHTLLGDGGDNIPNVYYGTKFTDNFKSYLKNNGIYVEDPYEFEQLSIHKKLYKEYDIYKTNRKGEVLTEKDIFVKVPFGEVKANKAKDNLQNFLKDPMLKKNFKKNAELVLFDKIPKDIEENIIYNYHNLEIKYNPNKIMEVLMKNNLRKLLLDISDFYIVPQKKKSILEEWV